MQLLRFGFGFLRRVMGRDDGAAVGYISSGGYAHHVCRSMAMGYVPAELASGGQKLEVEILGEMYRAEVQAVPLYDLDGLKMRG